MLVLVAYQPSMLWGIDEGLLLTSNMILYTYLICNKKLILLM